MSWTTVGCWEWSFDRFELMWKQAKWAEKFEVRMAVETSIEGRGLERTLIQYKYPSKNEMQL